MKDARALDRRYHSSGTTNRILLVAAGEKGLVECGDWIIGEMVRAGFKRAEAV